jgi:hypothetical protein
MAVLANDQKPKAERRGHHLVIDRPRNTPHLNSNRTKGPALAGPFVLGALVGKTMALCDYGPV